MARTPASGPGTRAASMTARASPAATVAPGATARDTTVPDAGAPTTCSIFIDSRITTGAPVATTSPTATGTACHRALEGREQHDLRAGHRLAVSVGHPGQAAGIGKMLGSSRDRRHGPFALGRVHRREGLGGRDGGRAARRGPRACTRHGRPGSTGRSRPHGPPPHRRCTARTRSPEVRARSAQGRAAAALMAITPTSWSAAWASSASASPPVGRVRPQLRIDREHHRVEVVAAQRLEVGGRRRQVVPGDADPAAQPLVPGRQDGLDGAGPGIELLQVGDRVELVEVEVVAVEEPEGLLELGPHPVTVVPERLAGHEEPVPHGRDERSEQLLGPAVLGGHVEVVDPGGQRLVEGRGGGIGIRVPEGGAAQDGYRRAVPGPPQSSYVHACTVVRRPALRAGRGARPRSGPSLPGRGLPGRLPPRHHGTEPHGVVDVLLIGPLAVPGVLEKGEVVLLVDRAVARGPASGSRPGTPPNRAPRRSRTTRWGIRACPGPDSRPCRC